MGETVRESDEDEETTCDKVSRADGEDGHVNEAGGVDEDLKLVGIATRVDEVEEWRKGAQQRGIEEEPSPGEPIVLDVFDHRVVGAEADTSERLDHLAMFLETSQRGRERETERGGRDLVRRITSEDK
jgi:hypothetical protein